VLYGAFWMQVTFMALDNVVSFSVWWIFFARFDDIGGWTLGDVVVLAAGLAGRRAEHERVVASGRHPLVRILVG
jgi:hypothetical protein